MKYNQQLLCLRNKMKYLLPILLLFISCFCSANAQKVDLVLVKKSAEKMYLFSEGKVLKTYSVSLGANPDGHKEQEGDERTPQGNYVLDYKKEDSSFYKAIHISYPNKIDIEQAKKAGVSPGGQIMIHGQKNGFAWLSGLTQYFNWTDGCIAVTNQEMDEIWNLVDTGTPIEIQP